MKNRINMLQREESVVCRAGSQEKPPTFAEQCTRNSSDFDAGILDARLPDHATNLVLLHWNVPWTAEGTHWRWRMSWLMTNLTKNLRLHVRLGALPCTLRCASFASGHTVFNERLCRFTLTRSLRSGSIFRAVSCSGSWAASRFILVYKNGAIVTERAGPAQLLLWTLPLGLEKLSFEASMKL